MSFYIRDISSLGFGVLKTNADLLVVADHDISFYQGCFLKIYFYDDSNRLCVLDHDKSKRLYMNHNNHLLFLDNLNLNNINKFISKKLYSTIEIVLPIYFDEDLIDKYIDACISLYDDEEVNIGFIVKDSKYIDSHKDFLLSKGIYISKYIPHRIDIHNFIEGDSIIHQDGCFDEYSCLDAFSLENFYFKSKIKKEDLPKNFLRVSKSKQKVASAASYVVDESFYNKLIKYLNKSKKSNVEVYTAGGITRKLFSKILSSKSSNPKKDTICCLIIGMELCLDDALDLLNAAGYTLTNSLLSDVIIKKHITDKQYNIELINEELDSKGLTVLGWKPREEI